MTTFPEPILKQIADRKGWCTLAELAELRGLTASAVLKGIARRKYTNTRHVDGIGGRGGKVWQIHISDQAIPGNIRLAFSEYMLSLALPDSTQRRADGVKAPLQPLEPSTIHLSGQGEETSNFLPGHSIRQLSDEEIEITVYAAAPEYARRKADKYLHIINSCAGMKGTELRQFVAEWNSKHPESKTSYDAILDARKKYLEEGVSGLLAKYGKTAGITSVDDDHFEYFKSKFMKEGGPSLKTCWIGTLGYARTLNPELDLAEFPSSGTFLRRLEKEVSKDSIYLARNGRALWNRKYGNYVDRDYSTLKPGECIVGDHHQVDVCVLLPNGKICFPWLTAWRDFKSSKWVGWMHHPEAPNSDHVFMSFYYAADEHGVPTDVYIDNGKDYRCRDFAGGRKYYKVTVDEGKSASMLALLGTTPHFALPYNAQSKTIERDFLKYKEWFSKNMPGYRGGHVKERPEKLKSEIKAGLILHWDEYVQLMDNFIVNVLNKMPSDGKVLQGMSPDEMWAAERIEKRVVSRDALKLFCMRTSNTFTIGKNGIKDSAIGCSYWGEWMSAMKGTKVYIRRDIKVYDAAWVFRVDDDEYLGKAFLAETASALARTNIEKAQLREVIAQKRQVEKIAKSFAETKDGPTASEVITHMAAGVEALNVKRGYVPKDEEVRVEKIANTAMDQVVLKDREMESIGTLSLSHIQPPERTQKKIALFECEKNFEDQYGEAQGQ